MTAPAIAVVGGGRVGLSLARALARSGPVAVLSRGVRPLPAPLAPSTVAWEPALAAADVVLVAVPDDAIGAVALRLAQGGAVQARHAVLHTSGRQDRSALAALEASGASRGSFHPLQTLRDPEGSPEALVGAPAVLEGDTRAVDMGRALAIRLQMAPALEIPASGKPRYHAAAVFASNYLVVLADVAARLARGAGLEATAELFLPLMGRTLVHLGDGDPAAALTGPVRRGDVGTVEAHLAALDGEARALYLLLAREALALAEREGLDEERAAALRQVLE